MTLPNTKPNSCSHTHFHTIHSQSTHQAFCYSCEQPSRDSLTPRRQPNHSAIWRTPRTTAMMRTTRRPLTLANWRWKPRLPSVQSTDWLKFTDGLLNLLRNSVNKHMEGRMGCIFFFLFLLLFFFLLSSFSSSSSSSSSSFSQRCWVLIDISSRHSAESPAYFSTHVQGWRDRVWDSASSFSSLFFFLLLLLHFHFHLLLLLLLLLLLFVLQLKLWRWRSWCEFCN